MSAKKAKASRKATQAKKAAVREKRGTAPVIPDLQVQLDLHAISTELGIPLEELEAAQRQGVFDLGADAAVDSIATWLEDPVQFVRDVFNAEPDEWQADALRAMATKPRVALKACKGPGKSTALAWFAWWCLALHEHCNGFALSITADNLKDGLWKECALWYMRSPFLQQQFRITAERIFHLRHERTWWLSARAFSKQADASQQANTLAGLHAQFVFILCDESSDYPPGVMGAVEGIFSNVGHDGAEAHAVQAGNPTRQEGPLWDACTRDRALWFVIEITGDPDDVKRSKRISLTYAREVIAQWGRDNPMVQVNILGQFPPTAADKLVGPNDIQAAEARDCRKRDYENEALIAGLDVARGSLDASVLTLRRGPVKYRSQEFRNLDGPELAQRVAMVMLQWEKKLGARVDAIFVDLTGVGASAYDHLKLLSWPNVVGVHFAGKPDDPRFLNKRVEMWWRMAQWVKGAGCIPQGDNILGRDLVAPTVSFKSVQGRAVYVLESKEEMAKKGIPSTDHGDALALTFYSPIVLRREEQQLLATSPHHAAGASVTHDYNPHA